MAIKEVPGTLWQWFLAGVGAGVGFIVAQNLAHWVAGLLGK